MKDKEQTKQKLISSVGAIIRSKGYQGLGVNAIAREAGVDKKLIYRYFGNVDTLIETYVVQKDYWLSFNKKIEESIEKITRKDDLALIITTIFEKQFEYFFDEEEMQKIILWEISEKTELMNSLCRVKENFGDKLFAETDKFFLNSNVNFRSISALLVGGIYYLILHSKKNDCKACGIDINTEEGKNEIRKAIRQIVHWSLNLRNEPVGTYMPDFTESFK
nr:TetR/AcrR family transcriptional regulator [Pedobacter sp. ASV19]